MVKQGDIIKINLDPKVGHEQKGYRPYVYLSHETVDKYSNIAIFAPISNTARIYPFYLQLPAQVKTTGKILLDQIVAIDYKQRESKFIESLPDDYLNQVLNIARAVFQKMTNKN
ncbi:type II toxin-antitoxin system PemK/MazF family toxin [Lactococcus insecticola]|uniref:mRNA interferase PemK n=1 Tax=Pseudolactococcus insecticola TaxID=2709158 RepID=A0A6A0BA14_9LACT|nr:type II toxin-antitoxin system PemK/MazF family toxin [Lactococcus insecticola]GFH41298.1 mRNA interferase PemK [Lactococcus insecticola]